MAESNRTPERSKRDENTAKEPESSTENSKKARSIDIKVIKPADDSSNQNLYNNSDSLKPDTYWEPDDIARDMALNSERPSRDSILRRSRHVLSTVWQDSCIEKFLICLSYLFVVVCFPVSLFCVFLVVRQFERAIILRNGKVHRNRAFGPGLIHYLPCVDIVKFTDLRIICYAVPPQEALTKDSLTVSVDAVVYYKICDPISAVINVANYKSSTQLLAATTLRNALGTRKLVDLLIDRPAVCFQIFQNMKRFAREWGIKLVRVEMLRYIRKREGNPSRLLTMAIRKMKKMTLENTSRSELTYLAYYKDISLPTQLQKTMATEAESSRLANAKVIVSKAEIEVTRNLQKATTMLMDNPLCMQLRYLQTLQTIASDRTHTIIIPFSVETMKKIFKS